MKAQALVAAWGALTCWCWCHAAQGVVPSLVAGQGAFVGRGEVRLGAGVQAGAGQAGQQPVQLGQFQAFKRLLASLGRAGGQRDE